jgi:hypothetical protein
VPQITAHNRIVLKASYSEGGSQHEEGILAAAGSPGMNVVMTSATERMKVHTITPGPTAVAAAGSGAAAGPVKLLKEDVLNGRTVDTAYAVGEQVPYHNCQPGDIVQVRVQSGQTVVKGNGASAVATGLWNVATVNSVAEFLEGSGGAALTVDTLMRARIF